mmetsp:Transcript_47454/g.54806  ORF Transcript_47454/g.54806 Transcript_47454/m.54806 type:complete len:97 (+) Transcript_47454:346-636(+)
MGWFSRVTRDKGTLTGKLLFVLRQCNNFLVSIKAILQHLVYGYTTVVALLLFIPGEEVNIVDNISVIIYFDEYDFDHPRICWVSNFNSLQTSHTIL